MKKISGVEFDVRTKSITGGLTKGIKKVRKDKLNKKS